MAGGDANTTQSWSRRGYKVAHFARHGEKAASIVMALPGRPSGREQPGCLLASSESSSGSWTSPVPSAALSPSDLPHPTKPAHRLIQIVCVCAFGPLALLQVPFYFQAATVQRSSFRRETQIASSNEANFSTAFSPPPHGKPDHHTISRLSLSPL